MQIIPKEDLLTTALKLRDEENFETLIDVCGIDYLDYGKSEWETVRATERGFDRGVEVKNFKGNKFTDHVSHPSRFAVSYQLLSYTHNKRLQLKVYLDNDAPAVDSITSVWPSGNWYEREAYDLYGIVFHGHPDLRRILTDYGFEGHPFRKDFPLSGYVEVRYDEKSGQVINEPVSIAARVLVPKVIREDKGKNHVES